MTSLPIDVAIERAETARANRLEAELSRTVRITPKRKPCNACGEVKPLEAFYRRDDLTDGREGTCKACRIKRQSGRNAETLRRYRERNRAVVRARSRARTRALEALARRFPADFNELHAIERAAEGLDAPSETGGRP